MSLNDELLLIRLELKGQREAISGLRSVDKAQQGLSTSTTATGTAAGKAEKKTSRLSRAYASLGKTARWGFGIIGVAGVFALKNAITNTEELAKTTLGLSRNLGLSTNVASRWGAVAQARGIDSKALGMSFGVLSSKMVEAGRKGGTLLTPFHLLGISQDEVAKGAGNFQWGIMRVVKALGEEEGGSKRAAAAKAVLGKGYSTILPLFAEGTKGLKEQLHWADKYGVTLNGKTNGAIMDMVTAQRESKVAVLGLQLALTKALMPAIVGGQHELQKFIATLNDPNLTGNQKISRIEQQFLGLEDTLIGIITDALPKVAEQGGALGLKLAGAVWSGFIHSDLKGKLVISAWLLHFMGGGGLIKGVAGRAGKAIAVGILTTLFPALAAEFAVTGSLGLMLKARFANLGTVSGRVFTAGMVLGTALIGFVLAEQLDKHTHFRQWGINAAENFANGLIEGLNKLSQLGKMPGEMNPVLELLGIDPSNPIPPVNLHNEGSGRPKNKFGIPHADPSHPGNPFHIGQGHKHHGTPPRLPRLNMRGFGGAGRPITVPITVMLPDGQVLAKATAHAVAAGEALS